MQSLKGFSAWAINKHNGTTGSVWQQSFYDRVIRDEEHLRQAIDYIHYNPVELGLAMKAEQYRYSSAFPEAQTDIEGYLAQ